MKKIYLSLFIDGDTAMTMAATKTENGVIIPLCAETEHISPANKCGLTTINDDTRLTVSRLIHKIVNKIEGNNEVTGIYLGIMPRSMHSETVEVRRDFNGKHRITENDIDKLDREIGKGINDIIVAKYDNGFLRDGVEARYVRNELADYVVRKCLAVVVSPRHSLDYHELFPANIRLHSVVPTQVAIARVVADEEQRVNGVISFHIGNQSSGLTYISEDYVKGTAVVPFGFDHILRDMTLDEVPVEKIRSFVESSRMKYKWAAGTTMRFSSEGPIFNLSNSIEAFNARIREIFSLGYDRILASLNLQELKAPVIVTSSFINTPEFAEAVSALIEQDCTLGNSANVLNDDNFAAHRFIPLIAVSNEATNVCIEERTVDINEFAEDEDKAAAAAEKEEVKKNEKKKSIFDFFKEQTLKFNDED